MAAALKGLRFSSSVQNPWCAAPLSATPTTSKGLFLSPAAEHSTLEPHIVDRRIDVLIPVCDAAATLQSAIESILAQTVSNIRVIVIDDGSTDATPAILARLAARDPRIVVITRPSSGIVDALNAGLALCSAEFVARHDADDIAYPDRFAAQLAYLDAHANCIALSSFARQIDAHGHPSGALSTFPPPDCADLSWVPCREPYLLHPFLMARRSALLALGGYRYAHHAEDADLCWRLQEIGTLHVMPTLLGDYRLHSQSITGRSALNGRLSAINSQLAAVSAMRRRNHKTDLQFNKTTIGQMTDAGTLAGIFDIGQRNLSSSESAYLKAAFAAKFLELASYRPYELDLDDCRFVAAALIPAESQLSPLNRTALRCMRAKSAARLLIAGRLRSALALVNLATFIETAARFSGHVIARCLPSSARAALWAWRSRNVAVKLTQRSPVA
jgi:glycosyltransferase involved in cell wall biosynthesis